MTPALIIMPAAARRIEASTPIERAGRPNSSFIPDSVVQLLQVPVIYRFAVRTLLALKEHIYKVCRISTLWRHKKLHA